MISSGSLNQSITDLKVSSDKIAQETSRLRDASDIISSDAEELMRKLEGVPDNIFTMRQEIAERFDSLSINDQIESKYNGNLDDNGGIGADASIKPIGFILGTYLISLAFKYNKEIYTVEIFKDLDDKYGVGYITGTINALKTVESYGLIIEGVGGNFVVKSIGKLPFEKIIEKVKWLSRPDEKKGSNGLDERIFHLISAANKYFGEDVE